MTLLRVGIAGYGIIGPRRRLHIDDHPNLKTVAVCDKTFAECGTFRDGVKYFNDYRQLLCEDLDVLFVCVTHDIAPEITIAGLERGLHVFCEKPPGRHPDDIRQVIVVEQRHPELKLKYGFNHRYHDSVRDAMRIIQSGEVGQIINLRGLYGKSAIVGRSDDWRGRREIAGGGILLDQGIHMLDLMRMICGEFTEVKSFVTNSHWGHDVEDNAYAIMRTDTGVVAMIHSTATQWRHKFKLEIALTGGSIALSGILTGSKSYGQETMTISYSGKNDAGVPAETVSTYIHDNSWRDEIWEFAAAIAEDTPILIGNSRDAYATLRLVYDIYEADPRWAQTYSKVGGDAPT